MKGLPEDQSGSLSIRIPVIKEQLVVNKQLVETGKVRVTKKIVETNETVDVSAVYDEIETNRVIVNQYIDEFPPAIRYEGDTTIISVTKEVLVVEKRLMLVEELHITKRQITKQAEHQETVRREEINIEHIKNNETDK